MNLDNFVSIINAFTGEKTITKEKLTTFLYGAKKAAKTKGQKGFNDYIRSSLGMDLPDSILNSIVNQVKNDKTRDSLIDSYNLPKSLKKKGK